jgi:MoaA/NifB/PqqE/SkfB family radical SAM enzyme
MHRDEGIMDMALFRTIADEVAALGIAHMRMHNDGEAFADRNLVEKVRYAKSIGVREVGLISNGSLITERAARGMIETGLDAIKVVATSSG